jgi:hypothetical protein
MDYIIPFHGAVGVLASPDSRTFLSSQACFTSNLNNLSVPITANKYGHQGQFLFLIG